MTYPNKKQVLFLALLAFSLSACSRWPEIGAGGISEQAHREPIEETLVLRLDSSRQAIDQLAVDGERKYNPASLVLIERQWVLSHRNAAAGFHKVASTNLDELDDQITKLQSQAQTRRRMPQ